MSMLAGLDTGELGPLRRITIKRPPTLEWVSHGCVECGTGHSFAWRQIPYRDTMASVCGRCWGLPEPGFDQLTDREVGILGA